jgi:hypothetical protein
MVLSAQCMWMLKILAPRHSVCAPLHRWCTEWKQNLILCNHSLTPRRYNPCKVLADLSNWVFVTSIFYRGRLSACCPTPNLEDNLCNQFQVLCNNCEVQHTWQLIHYHRWSWGVTYDLHAISKPTTDRVRLQQTLPRQDHSFLPLLLFYCYFSRTILHTHIHHSYIAATLTNHVRLSWFVIM